MKSLRMLSHLLSAVCFVALGLAILTATTPAVGQSGISYCGCVPGAVCTPPGYCGWFAACGTCTCVPDPIFPGWACI